jgi:ParB family chromosome partitioning protein
MAYQQLIQEFHLTQEEIASRVSKNRATITNSMRLLKLDKRVQQLVAEGQISNGHARALLGLEDREQQYQIAKKVVQENLSVRDVEKLVKMMNRPERDKGPKKEKENLSLIYQQIEDKLKSIMGTKVIINRKDKNKGRIEIEYYSQEELERLIEMMESIRG